MGKMSTMRAASCSSMFTVTHFLVIICLSGFFISKVGAGFSQEVCDSMNPTDSISDEASPVLVPAPANASDPEPVSITLSPSFYRANSKINLTISGEFSQFILQARSLGSDASGPPTLIGKFLSPLPKGVEFLDCENSGPHTVVTHSNEYVKSSISLLWEAPAANEGTFEFVLTVVNGSYYWMKLKSHSVNFRIFPPEMLDCGETVGCFVHQTTESDCTKGGCEIVAKNYIDEKKNLATFVLGRKLPKLSGYVAVAFTDQDNNLKDMVMMACVKHYGNVKAKNYYVTKTGVFDKFNVSNYVIPMKEDLVDNMMWCSFQFQIKKIAEIKKDLTLPRYRLYFTGDIDDEDWPILPEKDHYISEVPMHLSNKEYIMYSTEQSGSSINSMSAILIASSIFFTLK